MKCLLEIHQTFVSNDTQQISVNRLIKILPFSSSDVEFMQLVQTILSTYHISEIVDRIANYIRKQPHVKVILTTALALFFSPLLLFICLMGIGALSVLIPLSLFYQSFVFMVIISGKFLGKLVLTLAKES